MTANDWVTFGWGIWMLILLTGFLCIAFDRLPAPPACAGACEVAAAPLTSPTPPYFPQMLRTRLSATAV